RYPCSFVFPYTTLFRSGPSLMFLHRQLKRVKKRPSPGYFKVFEDGRFNPYVYTVGRESAKGHPVDVHLPAVQVPGDSDHGLRGLDRKSTRLNSSHVKIS